MSMKGESSVRVRKCARCAAPLAGSVERCALCGGLAVEAEAEAEAEERKRSDTYDRVSEMIRERKDSRKASTVEAIRQKLAESSAAHIVEMREESQTAIIPFRADGGTRWWRYAAAVLGTVALIWVLAGMSTDTAPTDEHQGCQSVCVERAVRSGKTGNETWMSLCRANCMKAQQ